MAQDLNYVSLINRVISDYNAIEDALIPKFTGTASQFIQGSIPTDQYDDKISLLTYINADFASNLHGETTRPNTITGIIDSSAAHALNAQTINIDESGNYLIYAKLNESAYIDSNVELLTTLNDNYIDTLTISGDLKNFNSSSFELDEGDNSFIFRPNTTSETAKLIKDVTLSKMTKTVTAVEDGDNKTGITFTKNLTSSSSVVTKDDDPTLTTVELSEAVTNYVIRVHSDANLTNGKITAKQNLSLTAGYTAGVNEVLKLERESIEAATGNDLDIYLKAGSVDIFTLPNDKGENTKATISADDMDIFLTPTEEATAKESDYIEITTTVGTLSNVRAKYNDGYVVRTIPEGMTVKEYEEKGQPLTDAQITIDGSTAKLRKGKIDFGTDKDGNALNVFTVAPDRVVVTGGTDIIANDTNDTDVVTVEFNTEEKTGTFGVDAGYIYSAEKTVKAAPYQGSFNIKKAKRLKASAGITGYTPTDNDHVTTDSNVNVYTVTVTPTLAAPSVAVDNAFNDGRIGWVSAASEISGVNTTSDAYKNYTINIPKASVSSGAPTITISNIVDNEDDYTGGTLASFAETLKATLTEEEKESGDYLELTATPGFGLTNEGFIKRSDISNLISGKAYIPKATFAWSKVGEGEEAEEALQVIKGGYIPSGFITSISNIENLNDYDAEVDMTLTSETNNVTIHQSLPTGTEATSYEKLSIGFSSINAGYVSRNNATSVFNNLDFYIEKAVLAPTVTLNLNSKDYTESEIKWDSTNEKYTFEVAASATASMGEGAKAGYLSAVPPAVSVYKDGAEVDGHEDKVQMSIPTATFSKSTHTTDISLTATALTGLMVEEGGYSITPTITSCSVELEVLNAGYISNFNTDRLKFDNTTVTSNGTLILGHGGDRQTLRLKQGTTTASIRAGNNVNGVKSNDITDGKITSALSGNVYPVSISGKIFGNITVDTGVYTSTEVNALSATATEITLPNNISVNISKGSVTPSIQTNGLTTFTPTVLASDLDLNDKKFIYDHNEIYTENNILKDGNSRFLKISSSGSVKTVTTVDEGYIKPNEHTEVSNFSVTGDTYIKLFETTEKTYSDKTNYGFAIGNNDITKTLSDLETNNPNTVTVETAGKFLSKDVVVTVNEHAMGDSVLNQLIQLQNRLSGTRP